MKNILLLSLLTTSLDISAQWQGTNPVYFNVGSVGIGTSSPIGKLDINQAGGQLRLSGGTVAGGVWTNANDILYLADWNTGTKGLIVNMTSGNVGIGTTSPGTKLHVSGLGAVRQRIEATDNGYAELYLTSNNKTWSLSKRPGTEQDAFGVFHYNGTAWGSSLLSVLPIGNVGIGTSTPTSKLQVLSNDAIGAALNSEVLITRFSTNVANSQSLDLKLRKYSTTDNAWWGNSLRLQRNIDDAVNSCYIDFGASEANLGSGSHELGFGVGNTEHMRISSGGNVGIGTTAPDAKLAVKGTVHAQEVKVDLSVPGPDYVFDNDYKLLSLEEIKTYIDKNKHLPEVPSAKEMEANGVNLGEMNMLLLKKIEELTLYLIEQNKRTAKSEKENGELKERVSQLELLLKK